MALYGGIEYLYKLLLWPQKISILGLDNLPQTPFILVLNHRGPFDPFLFAAATLKNLKRKIFALVDRRFLFFLPSFVREFFGLIPASRIGLRIAQKHLEDGYSIGIFVVPRDPKRIHSARPHGAIWLGKNTGFPIIPAAISGTRVYGLPIAYLLRFWKSFFENKHILIGQPYFVGSAPDFEKSALTILARINVLLKAAQGYKDDR